MDRLDVAGAADTSRGSAASLNTSNTDLSSGEYRLLWRRSLPDPIFYVKGMDVTGDGLNEVVVLSLKGLHILQVGHHIQVVSMM